MDLIKASWAICLQNLRKWATDYRMWTIAALLIIMVQIYVDDMQKVADLLGTKISVWIFPFLYAQFHTKVIFTLPVVLMFCNAPFTDKNQIFVHTRTGRARWLLGQIVYIFIASAFYYLFVLLISIILTVFIAEPSFDWGKTINMIAFSGVAQQAGSFYLDVPPLILEFFTPLQAVFFTLLTSWLSAILLGLIVFFFNLITETRFIGIIISSALVVWTVLVSNDGFKEFMRFSPVSWNTLNNIDAGKMTPYPSFGYCMCVYAVLISALIIGIFVFGKRKSLDVKGDR